VASFSAVLRLKFSCTTPADRYPGGFAKVSIWELRFTKGNPYGFIILFVLGLTSGLLSAWFLSRVPDITRLPADVTSFHIGQFLQPLKDKNFRTLTLFVACWTFAIQRAAPFYGVLMIDHLKANFSTMTLFVFYTYHFTRITDRKPPD
jgi:hypothetical protein